MAERKRSKAEERAYAELQDVLSSSTPCGWT